MSEIKRRVALLALAIVVAAVILFVIGGRGRTWYAGSLVGHRIEIGATGGGELVLYVSKPDGAGPFPAVVLLHELSPGGEPTAVTAYEFARYHGPRLSGWGFASISVDYRSSPLGGSIIDDVVDAIRWTKQQDFLDSNKITLLGQSLGGYLALMASTREPVDTLISVSALTDVRAQYSHEEEHEVNPEVATVHMLTRTYGTPEENPDKFSDLSPLAHVGEMRANSVAIFHGDPDPAVPVEHAYKIHNALSRAGRNSAIEIIAGAGHDLLRGPKADDFWARLSLELPKG